MNPLAVLGLLLVISLAGNAWQFHERDGLVTEAATQKATAGQAFAAASSCSASVDKLAKQGKTQQAGLLAAIAGSSGQVQGLQQEALAAIKARPANPNDLCGSLVGYLKAEIARERGK